MKNDIILFAIMFAVAWIGYTAAKDRLNPTPIISQETVGADATNSIESDPSATTNLKPMTDSASEAAVGQTPAGDEPKNSPAGSKPKDVAPPTEKKSAEPKSAEQKIEQVLSLIHI